MDVWKIFFGILGINYALQNGTEIEETNVLLLNNFEGDNGKNTCQKFVRNNFL